MNYVQKRLEVPKVLNVTNLCYNLSVKEDKFCCASGFKHLCLPVGQASTTEQEVNEKAGRNFTKLWSYKYYSQLNLGNEYYLIALGDDGYLYYKNLFSTSKKLNALENFYFPSTPCVLNFSAENIDSIAFCEPSHDMMLWQGDNLPATRANLPKFLSICYLANRMFAIDVDNPKVVRYSALLNPLDWTSNNLVSSAGEININMQNSRNNNLVAFGDSVYVFRDYGITKITPYANCTEFVVKDVYETDRKILSHTTCLCGDNVYFVKQNGVFVFDGFDCKKVDINLGSFAGHYSFENSNVCVHAGKVYVALKIDFDDGEVVGCEVNSYTNNSLISYDLDSKETEVIRGVDVKSMLSINHLFLNKLVVAISGSSYLYELSKDGKVDSVSLTKFWQADKLDFDYVDKRKTIKEIYLTLKGSAVLSVLSESMGREIEVSGNGSPVRVFVNVAGREFSLKLSSTDENFSFGNLLVKYNLEK